MENGPGLKMYFLLRMGIFHCYVSLPEVINRNGGGTQPPALHKDLATSMGVVRRSFEEDAPVDHMPRLRKEGGVRVQFLVWLPMSHITFIYIYIYCVVES